LSRIVLPAALVLSLLPLATAQFSASAKAAAPAKPAAAPAAPTRLSLKDGDRVLLLGSTFIEREQAHGYIETALTSRFPGAKIEFRNLGWSGDNVYGEARAGFGPIEEGFKHLKDHVASLKPTVILLNYGANESFAGEAGLDKFLAGLDVLLKTLDESGARIVFVLPPPQEDLGRPLPDPKQHNADLKLYSKAIAKVAAERGAQVCDLNTLLDPKTVNANGPLTDNGLHLTDYGYWRTAPLVEQGLGLPSREWRVDVDARRGNVTARGTKVSQAKISPQEIRFVCRDAQLPLPPAPIAPVNVIEPRTLRVFDLPRGTYELKIDGKAVAQGTAEEWARGGVSLEHGPEPAQAEALRQAIRGKNELYFHRWRPQNVTYLFGFRKHEQGNNAVEIPQFDPLIAEREVQIRTLSVPVEHAYQLVKVEK
jgi:lysophospholipase L1-like esterase